MDNIEEKANAEAVLDEMAEKVADQLSQRLAWQDIRTPLQRKTDEDRAATRALGDELYAEHMGLVTDPNEMRRNAWRWYAGNALALQLGAKRVDGTTESFAAGLADNMLAEEESRFGKIGGERG